MSNEILNGASFEDSNTTRENSEPSLRSEDFNRRNSLAQDLLVEFDREKRDRNIKKDSGKLFKEFEMLKCALIARVPAVMQIEDSESALLVENDSFEDRKMIPNLTTEDLVRGAEAKLRELQSESQSGTSLKSRNEIKKWDHLFFVAFVADRITKSGENYIPNLNELANRYSGESFVENAPSPVDVKSESGPLLKDINRELRKAREKNEIISSFLEFNFNPHINELGNSEVGTYALQAKRLIDNLDMWKKFAIYESRQQLRDISYVTIINSVKPDDLGVFVESKLDLIFWETEPKNPNSIKERRLEMREWQNRKNIISEAMKIGK